MRFSLFGLFSGQDISVEAVDEPEPQRMFWPSACKDGPGVPSHGLAPRRKEGVVGLMRGLPQCLGFSAASPLSDV